MFCKKSKKLLKSDQTDIDAVPLQKSRESQNSELGMSRNFTQLRKISYNSFFGIPMNFAELNANSNESSEVQK
jgi:hypothetical protein